MKRQSQVRSAPPVKTPKRPTPAANVPAIIRAATLDDHLDVMTRAIFQAGLSWAMIAARWPAFRAAFEGFAVQRVAAYGEDDLTRLMATDGLIHSPKKFAGTFANARALLDAEREFGTIDAYAAAFRTYGDLLVDARRRFAFVGDLSCYYWLFRTAQRVPPFEDWITRQATDHPRMREMVMLARSEQSSPEKPGF